MVASLFDSVTGVSRKLTGWPPFLVILLATTVYLPAIDNFFTWDDFVWLQKSATLLQNPTQIFNVDVIYFDPLVYLSFWLNYLLAPFDYRLYHALDIAMHAINGILIWHLVRRLTLDQHSAFAASVIFTISFATVDAVVWSSSRVDLLSVLFSLVSLGSFQTYLSEKLKRSLIISLIAYILALSAKGTPVVVPMIMAFMLIQNGVLKQQWRSMIPFVVLTVTYFTALTVQLASAGKGLTQSGGIMPNFMNLFLALTTLFVPERFVAQGFYSSLAVTMMIILSATSLGGDISLRRTRILGLVIIFAGLVPVLVLNEFKLATTIDNAGYLLKSPSHRIYLASIGMAIFYGGLFGELIKRTKRRTLLYFIWFIFMAWSILEIQVREKLWDGSSRYIRASVEGIAHYRGQINDDSVVGLVNFPMSRGFMRPVLYLYCNVVNVLFLPMDRIPEEVLDAPEILRYQNRGHFYVYGTQVHDLSEQFNRLLATAFNYQVSSDSISRSASLREYQSTVREINNAIAVMKFL